MTEPAPAKKAAPRKRAPRKKVDTPQPVALEPVIDPVVVDDPEPITNERVPDDVREPVVGKGGFIKNRPDLPGPPNHPPSTDSDPPPPTISGDPENVPPELSQEVQVRDEDANRT